MCINAINAHEASKQILRVICTTDYKQSRYRASQHGYTFVYFSSAYCRYYFESQQRKDTRGLIKRYGVMNIEDVIEITAIKYSFAQIAIGAIVSRKFMTYREFFEIVRVHYDWVK
ncbi:hypothetical protein [Sulfuricurvum sp.]|uniref:hypothetical protein n=1 Tax=Sulfuricurvum sp. TaxID=2025608 RepID=UPI002E2F8508|nr:hypothetical protein [Sulfuricurvum sp.]HEX5329731.1 hypothetical protein [Sulfuricurvum sp.]